LPLTGLLPRIGIAYTLGGMRIATFNILSGRRPGDAVADLDAFARAVADLDADVLALQEVDRNQPRSRGADLTAIAAEAMGAVDHRFVAALTGTPDGWVASTPEDPADAPAYGVALLSRVPVVRWRVLRLPAFRGPAPMWWPGARRPTLATDEPRVAVAAQLETDGGPLAVVNTHLSFLPWWNGQQLDVLVRGLAALPRPLVLLGDLNMGPRRARRATGLVSLAEHPTFPCDQPRGQIDHVLADRHVRATSSEARRMAVSDHRALVVDLDHLPLVEVRRRPGA
jgi:endonuclease/exonuclease/phosphatase family metal-dependent hydrolase